MLDPEFAKVFCDVDADYYDIYEYLYETYIELVKIKAYLEIKPDCMKSCKHECFQNAKQAKKIITKTVTRISKIIQPWVDFMSAYSGDLQFGIKKKY